MTWASLHSQHGTKRRFGSQLERTFQISVIDYVRYAMVYNSRALTEWLFHPPNGGLRSVVTGAMFKAMGVRPGVPDLVLPIAAGGFGGLWIELKSENRNLTDSQMDFHQRLRDGGQLVTTCRALDETVDVLVKYMTHAPGKFEIRDAALANRGLHAK